MFFKLLNFFFSFLVGLISLCNEGFKVCYFLFEVLCLSDGVVLLRVAHVLLALSVNEGGLHLMILICQQRMLVIDSLNLGFQVIFFLLPLIASLVHLRHVGVHRVSQLCLKVNYTLVEALDFCVFKFQRILYFLKRAISISDLLFQVIVLFR